MIRCWEAMSSLGILRSTPLFCVAAERGVAPQWSVRVQISPIFQHGNFESCTRYRIDIYVSPLDSFRRIFVLPRSLVFLFEHLDLDSFIKDDIVFLTSHLHQTGPHSYPTATPADAAYLGELIQTDHTTPSPPRGRPDTHTPSPATQHIHLDTPSSGICISSPPWFRSLDTGLFPIAAPETSLASSSLSHTPARRRCCSRPVQDGCRSRGCCRAKTCRR